MAVDCSTYFKLTKEEYSFITSIVDKCANNKDSQISESTILRSLVRLLQRLEIDVSGIKTETELLQRLQNGIS